MHTITLSNILKIESIAQNSLAAEYVIIENAKGLIQAVK